MGGRTTARVPQKKKNTRRLGWLAIAGAAVTTGLVATALALGPAFAARGGGAPSAGKHGVDPKMAACERQKKVCNPAALAGLPFSGPDRQGASLITQRQLVARFGVAGSTLALARTTYGQVHAANPALAASDTVYSGRIVWLVTQYFSKPVTVHDGDGPIGASTTRKISVASFVIDAATGDVVDSCLGCAAVGRP